MSVTVNNNSPIQDYVHPDDQTQPTFEMTPGFKPFTVFIFNLLTCSFCQVISARRKLENPFLIQSWLLEMSCIFQEEQFIRLVLLSSAEAFRGLLDKLKSNCLRIMHHR